MFIGTQFGHLRSFHRLQSQVSAVLCRIAPGHISSTCLHLHLRYRVRTLFCACLFFFFFFISRSCYFPPVSRARKDDCICWGWVASRGSGKPGKKGLASPHFTESRWPATSFLLFAFCFIIIIFIIMHRISLEFRFGYGVVVANRAHCHSMHTKEGNKK